MATDFIRIRGAQQNNLKHLDLDIPLGQMVVITGVSGAGKSSLAFDTIYAEGQRRYVETFSAYARQFLERMDKPAVTLMDGVPAAIAIEQRNTVRASRSTLGTLTELADYLKLLYARRATLLCARCQTVVQRDTLADIGQRIAATWAEHQQLKVSFRIGVPPHWSDTEVSAWLHQQGYVRFHRVQPEVVEVVQDRLRLNAAASGRLQEALEAALKYGQGRVLVYALDEPAAAPLFFSDRHQCAQCEQDYPAATPNLFSFNSPLGACDACRGFGRLIGVDYGLVIPNTQLSLAEGAIKPIQTPAYREVQQELEAFARLREMPLDQPWHKLTSDQQHWVIHGEGSWDDGVWYGLERFFKWLESKSYKMHIRVLLSKYRAYTPCPDCAGTRLKPAALQWRLGVAQTPTALNSTAAIDPARGLSIADLLSLPLDQCLQLCQKWLLQAQDDAQRLLFAEMISRLQYLCDVGLSYLTLDRQTRTLSGGEVQRINLTTALGSSLVNTLFVLDEPTTGLHARDVSRLIRVLQALRDAGNSLLIVEHDAQVIQAADQVIDLGPGPGAKGGNLTYFGPPAGLFARDDHCTAQHVRAQLRVLPVTETVPEDAPWLELKGVSANNLKLIDVAIPLRQLVCLSGVSGSGKSTLVQQVLYPALCQHFGEPTEAPGPYVSHHGFDQISQVVLVDQSPLGKSSRSTPATYVGAWDAIRALFVASPLARDRGYTPGTFSFNSGQGRCPTCQGRGFEHIEMQFLSDVYLACSECNGSRFRPEILAVTVMPLLLDGSSGPVVSVADVLSQTVSQALAGFAAYPDIVRVLQPLAEVGLGYIKLGQAVPTLSGGEAQRLKLAAQLAKAKQPSKRPTQARPLLLLDEPTSGLHGADVAVLLEAFRALQQQGYSVVIIEHHLAVVAAADWVIDLGPEGGAEGGQVLAAGPVQVLLETLESHTGAALKSYLAGVGSVPAEVPAVAARLQQIEVRGARQHNLKNINVTLPHNQLTVISGVSGSGKSSLAFDLIFGEGQRRYLESLNAYARQFMQPVTRPDVDAIYGIPPAVAIEQRTSRGGQKSTVATLTELYHYLRLLFVKLGEQQCPSCQQPVSALSVEAIAQQVVKRFTGHTLTLFAPLVLARKGIYRELAEWAAVRGFSHLRVDGVLQPTAAWPVLDRYREHTIECPVLTLTVDDNAFSAVLAGVTQALVLSQGSVRVVLLESGGEEPLYSTHRACASCGQGFAELDPRLFSFNSKAGWCASCQGSGLQGVIAEDGSIELAVDAAPCSTCLGQRLNPIALNVFFQGRSISQWTAQSVTELEHDWAELTLDKRAQAIARDVWVEMRSRLTFLQQVGLGYLTLDRAAPTLSGGEAQRIRLAAQLGSSLQGVCYVLDEPTIGLHTRDNRRLLDTLRALQQRGNTVVVVEHDEDTIRAADYLIDVGPGAGVQGGQIVASGSLADVLAVAESQTGRMLRQGVRHPLPNVRHAKRRSLWPQAYLQVNEVRRHSVYVKQLKIPLRRLIAITGVSGSGKSTLVTDVLFTNIQQALRSKTAPNWFGLQALEGWQSFSRVLEVDQSPIGKTPRSCPATYLGIWDTIRKLFAQTVEARIRGYTAARFSFNAQGGRCEVCKGQGEIKVEMNFLPNVHVPCDSCAGWRFHPETLQVQYKGHHVGQVLAMAVDEAVEFFAAVPSLHHPLRLMQAVGLGYLTLGQQSPTLSGGEAQRLKLVAELSKANMTPEDTLGRQAQHCLYVLDEPTVGLHMADVEKLVRVLHQLVDAGHSVWVIEHNLDLVAEADWVIDLGPEGGSGGGKVVAQGTPQAVSKRLRSHTGQSLAALLMPVKN